MSVVERFDASMIEAALRTLELRPYYNATNEFLVTFTCERFGFTMNASFAAQCEGSLYVVRLRAGRLFSSNDWPLMLGLTNHWNVDNAWPHAHLAHLQGGTAAAVDCEGLLYAGTGVHQTQVVAFTDTVLQSTFDFWKWFLDQIPKPQPLPELDEMNQMTFDLGTDPGVFGT